MSGKGSSPRPYSVSQEIFGNNYDSIFRKKDNTMSEQKKGTCGCGRSPTGNCCGWHALTEEQYQQRLQEYQLKEQKPQ